jgi:antitoxin HigA-1
VVEHPDQHINDHQLALLVARGGFSPAYRTTKMSMAPPIHPGEILADELAELQMSAAQLSRELHVPTNRVTQILNGRRALTADTALRLGQWFGTGPELWINLQKQYELRLAEQEVGAEIRATVKTRSAS